MHTLQTSLWLYTVCWRLIQYLAALASLTKGCGIVASRKGGVGKGVVATNHLANKLCCIGIEFFPFQKQQSYLGKL